MGDKNYFERTSDGYTLLPPIIEYRPLTEDEQKKIEDWVDQYLGRTK